MTKLCGLCVLFCLIYTASSLKLQNLCEKDHFEYNGLLVNSVHMIRRTIQLETANSYLMDFDEEISYFPGSVNKTEFHFIREDL